MCLYSPTAVGKVLSSLSVLHFCWTDAVNCLWSCLSAYESCTTVHTHIILCHICACATCSWWGGGPRRTLCPLFVWMGLFRTQKGDWRKKFTITVKLLQYTTVQHLAPKMQRASKCMLPQVLMVAQGVAKWLSRMPFNLRLNNEP